MFYFKACPRCHGDLHLDRDQYGSFIECLHCGLIKDVKVKEEFTGNEYLSMQEVATGGHQQVASLAA